MTLNEKYLFTKISLPTFCFELYTGSLSNLVELYVSHNCKFNKYSIPDNIMKFKHLSVLYCSGNKIEDLPIEFAYLSCLKKVSF